MPQGTVTATITLDAAQLASLLGPRETDLESLMVSRLGETCSYAQARRELSCGPDRLDTLLEAGKVSYACEGTRISVRSLARYIEDKPAMDEQIRADRRRKNLGFVGV